MKRTAPESSADAGSVNVVVVYAPAPPARPRRISLRLPGGSTVADALDAARPLVDEYRRQVPALKVGVFGEPQALSAVLTDGDRVELLRPLLRSPTERRRQRLKRTPTN